MRKILQGFLLAFLVFVMTFGVALAATYEFYFPITATDNTSAARTYYPIITGLNGQSFVNSGKINADGLDTNIQIGASNVKYMMSTAHITAVAPSLPASGSATFNFYTGYSPAQTGFPIITGDGGYFTTTDSANLEWSSNGSVTYDGYIDTTAGSGKYLVQKANALEVFVSPTVSGNITAQIQGAATSQNVTLYPNGTGNYTNISSVGGSATHWGAVDDLAGAPDDDTTRVYNNSDAQQKDAYTLTDANLEYGSIINSVTVYYRFRGYVNVGDRAGYSQPYLRLSSSETTGTEQSQSGATYTDKNEALARPGGGSWSTSEMDSLEVAIGLRRTAGVDGDPSITQVYVVVNYTPPVSVSATGVSSGEHEVNVGFNYPFFGVSTNGTAASLPPTTNLTMNAPMWQSNLSAANFTSIDATQYPLSVSGANWTSLGRSFDGVNDYVTNNNNLNVNAAQSITILVWVKPYALGSEMMVANKGAVDNAIIAGNEGYSLRVKTNGNVQAETQDIDSNTSLLYGGTLSTSSFSLIGIIINRANNTMYIVYNGNIVTAVGVSGEGDLTNTNDFKISGYTNNPTYLPFYGIIGDVQYYSKAFSSAEVLEYYYATISQYNGNTGLMVSSYSTIPDTSSNIIFAQNNVSPYVTSIDWRVGGNQRAYYAPIAMLSGATIPDRSGNSNPATITWGSNTGLSIHYGSMVSSGSTTAAVSAAGGVTLKSVALPAHWYNQGADLSALPFYDMVSGVSSESGMPVQTIYFWVAIAFAWLAMIVMVAATKSAFVGAICMVLVLVVASMQGVVSGWIVFAVVVMDIMIVYLYRQVAS